MPAKRYRIRRSPFRFYDVQPGDIGRVLEIRYQGSNIEAMLLHMEKTGEEHWLRRCDLEPEE